MGARRGRAPPSLARPALARHGPASWARRGSDNRRPRARDPTVPPREAIKEGRGPRPSGLTTRSYTASSDRSARAAQAIEHEVVPGETLEKIAALYTVRPEWLVRWNPGLALDRPLQQGTLLRVETDRPGERRVRRCVTLTRPDSWESLARRLGIDAATLRAYNPRARDVLRGRRGRHLLRPRVQRTDPIRSASGARGQRPRYLPWQADPGRPRRPGARRVPLSPYYDLRCPAHAYASSHTIDKLLAALTDLRGRYDGQLIIGDLSREAGGAYGHHASHQTGRDVDIWLPVLGGCYRATPDCEHCRTPWCRPQTDEIDWAATWDLITALRATGAVQNIFLDRSLHPELRAAAEAAGLSAPDAAATIRSEPGAVAPVSHSNNHTQHIHVRFRCGPDEPGCQR
ncbi:penicillin-insensitive murein endopeptidase [Nannocystis sp.]|uniref:LysM peptidoglycan-binding domain-containing protein n=1 Tax=Nannocystis sp. TaxID=1962667 RepID=UPI0025FB3398|nr:penicillin-insensitive murein endopeptidase [Nannocystis sp.]MBK7827202.1 penicillin-insensitive murein endopeptidase [Nannocystis sp.]